MGGQAPGPAAAATARFYDRLAEAYDRLFAYPPRYSARQAAWLARMCRPGPLLDLGCGTGRMLAPLVKAGFSPWGLDCSLGMLAKARQAHPRAGLVQAEATAGLPFAEASFQSVVSLHAGLIHITEAGPRRSLALEVLRVLRPGGVFVVELPHPRSYPSCPAPNAWRSFQPGVSCRRVGPHLEELRLEDLGGLTTRVALLDLADLRQWLEGFSKVHVHPGFSGGIFDPDKGLAMVVCAYK